MVKIKEGYIYILSNLALPRIYKIGFVKVGMPVEISIDSFPSSDFGVLEGKVKINEEIYVKGDVFIIEPNEVVLPHFLEETRIVVVKTISDVNDKYIVE